MARSSRASSDGRPCASDMATAALSAHAAARSRPSQRRLTVPATVDVVIRRSAASLRKVASREAESSRRISGGASSMDKTSVLQTAKASGPLADKCLSSRLLRKGGVSSGWLGTIW